MFEAGGDCGVWGAGKGVWMFWGCKHKIKRKMPDEISGVTTKIFLRTQGLHYQRPRVGAGKIKCSVIQ